MLAIQIMHSNKKPRSQYTLIYQSNIKIEHSVFSESKTVSLNSDDTSQLLKMQLPVLNSDPVNQRAHVGAGHLAIYIHIRMYASSLILLHRRNPKTKYQFLGFLLNNLIFFSTNKITHIFPLLQISSHHRSAFADEFKMIYYKKMFLMHLNK